MLQCLILVWQGTQGDRKNALAEIIQVHIPFSQKLLVSFHWGTNPTQQLALIANKQEGSENQTLENNGRNDVLTTNYPTFIQYLSSQRISKYPTNYTYEEPEAQIW